MPPGFLRGGHYKEHRPAQLFGRGGVDESGYLESSPQETIKVRRKCPVVQFWVQLPSCWHQATALTESVNAREAFIHEAGKAIDIHWRRGWDYLACGELCKFGFARRLRWRAGESPRFGRQVGWAESVGLPLPDRWSREHRLDLQP